MIISYIRNLMSKFRGSRRSMLSEIMSDHQAVFSSFGNNIVAVAWDLKHGRLFETCLYVEGVDKAGTLFRIAESLFKHRGLNVKGLNIQTDNGLFNAQVTIIVHDTVEVAAICQDLMKIDSILKVVRI